MSEKYYVVSEDELVALHSYTCDNETADEAYTNCCARPVNAVPGRSTKGEGMCWIEEEV